ncbi:MAG: hypothetical protein ACXAEU_22170, partial [Candidatus Hodarchaeales archaeon]
PRMWKWRVQWKISQYFDIGFTFLVHLDPNFFRAIPKLLTYMKDVQTEITTHDSLEFSYNFTIDLSKETIITVDIIAILLDPDLSVVNALDAFKENQTRQNIFTGDEILNVINLVRAVETISGTFSQDVSWNYEDDSSPSLLTGFFANLFKHSHLTWKLMGQFGNFGRNLGLIRNFAGLRTFMYDSQLNGSKTTIRKSFDISQLQVNQVNFTTSQDMMVKDVAFNYIEHHSLGLFVYNDSNSNGFMDLAMLGERDELYTNSSEILYKIDFTSGTKTVATPVTDSDELTFGIAASGANAVLRPFHDKSLDPENVIQASVSEIGFTFHYEVNRTGDRPRSDLKFDYIIGDWTSGDLEFEDLSLSQMFVSTFTRSQVTKKVERVRNDAGSEYQDVNATRRNSRFNFALDDLDIGEIALDEIDYTWNGTDEETAYGQTIPLVFFKMVYGAHESNGDVSRALLMRTQGKSFLYSISYPIWSGESIEHDPTFSVVSAAATTGPTGTDTTETEPETTTTGGVVPGFEAWIALVTIPVIVYGLKKRK